MKTKVPFAGRCLVLCLIVIGVSGTIAAKLVDMQTGEGGKSSGTGDANIFTELLPAQRGIIMDRNESILTNNIQTANLVGDRGILRDIKLVIDDLAYNMAVHDPKWDKDDDPDARHLLFIKYRTDLHRHARLKLDPEERSKLLRTAAAEGRERDPYLDYDMKICDQYVELHDELVLNLLTPFLDKMLVADGTNSNGDTIMRPMSREELRNMIQQPEVEAKRKAAEAAGEPLPSFRCRLLIGRNLTPEVAEELRQMIEKTRIHGINLEIGSRRSYAHPESLCHVLGFVDYQNTGVNGIEGEFNSYLAGMDGLREFRRNNRGDIVANKDDRYLPAKHGLNIQLTIDMRLQRICEEELAAGMRRFNARRGCMIVVDPKTGDVLAMANYPGYNLNTKELVNHLIHRPDEKVKPQKDASGKEVTGHMNYACQARYEPGSTFKSVTASAAVDSRKFTIHSDICCDHYSVGNSPRITDGRFHYGWLPLWGVLAKSSNPGIARVAQVCGWDIFREYLSRFGLDRSTGIPLPSGGGCIISNGTKAVNLTRMAYGYSVMVSPLHMAMVYATIANGGVRMHPRLVHRIISPDGSVYDDCAPREACRVMSEKTAADLRFALERVTWAKNPGKVRRGTAVNAAIPGYRIGGKTGTAKKLSPAGTYFSNIYTVSFAGVLPIDDPRLVVMTVIDEPLPSEPIGVGGGTVAAPIFRAAAERFIEVLDIKPSDPEAFAEYQQKKQEEAQKKSGLARKR